MSRGFSGGSAAVKDARHRGDQFLDGHRIVRVLIERGEAEGGRRSIEREGDAGDQVVQRHGAGLKSYPKLRF